MPTKFEDDQDQRLKNTPADIAAQDQRRAAATDRAGASSNDDLEAAGKLPAYEGPRGRHATSPSPHGTRQSVSESDARAAKNKRIGDAQRPTASFLGSAEAGAEAPKGDENAKIKNLADAESGQSTRPGQGGDWNTDVAPTTIKGKFTRAQKIAAGAGGGFIGVIILFVVLFLPNFHLNLTMDDLHANRSTLLRRVITERSNRYVLTNEIKRAGGLPANYAEPNSQLDKLFKAYDKVDMTGELKKSGIEFKEVNGKVRLFFKGADIGDASDYKAAKKTLSNNRQARRAVTLTVTQHAHPVQNLFVGGLKPSIKRWVGDNIFRPPQEDKAKTKEENLEAFRADQIEKGTEGTLKEVDNVIKCLDGDCSGFEESDNPEDNKPISADKEERAQALGETISESAQEATDESAKTGKSFAATFREKIFAKIAERINTTLLKQALPIVDIIDDAALLDHIAYQGTSNHFAEKVPYLMKEAAYSGIAASWMGYSDNSKIGELSGTAIDSLNQQLEGSEGAQSYQFMYNDKTNSGVPVDPKVNNDVSNPYRDFTEAMYYKNPFVFAVHEVLNIWYKFSDLLSSVLGGVVGPILSFFWNNSAVSATLEQVFGPDWQTKFVEWCFDAFLHLYGLYVDPLAKGAAMFNNLYTGVDVLMNKYCLSIGCAILSTQQSGNIITNSVGMDERDRIVAMPIKDRLFSLNEPKSVASTFVRNTGDLTKANFANGVVHRFMQLPATVGTILSGHSMAATLDDAQNIDGVAQAGGTDADLDQDIAAEVRKANPPDCPAHDDQRQFNICMVDTALVQTGQCVTPDCPAYVDQSTDAAQNAQAGTIPQKVGAFFHDLFFNTSFVTTSE